MAEYRDLSEILTLAKDLVKRTPSTFYNGIHSLLQEIINLPAADVAPVRHGKWLSKEYMYGDQSVGIEDMWIDRLAEPSDYYAYCSACGEDAGYNEEGSLILSNYCPNCGAKMDGGGE